VYRDPKRTWRPWGAVAGWWRDNSVRARISAAASLVLLAIVVIAASSPSSSNRSGDAQASATPAQQQSPPATKHPSTAELAAHHAKVRAAARARVRAAKIRKARARARKGAAAKAAAAKAAAAKAAAANAAAAKEAAAKAAAAKAAAQAQRCNPNYSGCLDPNASDYDCEGGSGNGPYYTGTVEVIGYDEYGLDADGDGYGCD
jgi:membrane protein involved in colicin uptake